ncbi:cation-translocating P-type ATPase [Xanthovirga aplysinae]|uniref:cation-translocating P-type ATPase n=1 Tax=Xanthovirga aplysinae TaxID=2529853 RepID=UPI0012BD2A73|nr:HAD-IC family P-type ATPase [Xanthovirga aplysinae]MTI33049.1 HAD family hydrolase [Xanthovirga aplysinae]
MFYYQSSIESLFQAFKSRHEGLSEEEVIERLEKYGKNELPKAEEPSRFRIFFRQFKSPLIYILIFAGLLSVSIGEWADASFIMAVVLINAVVGGYQEWKAECSAQSLQEMIKVKAMVFRNQSLTTVDADHLVPGDIVWLESGMKVPADIRLIETNNLSVMEAMLTGESVPVGKDSLPLVDTIQNIGEIINMAFAGTTIMRGRARGLVVATGLETELGKLSAILQSTESIKTPLVERMEKLSKVISLVVLIIAVMIIILGVWQGNNLREMLFFAISIGVSAIPEGLPVSITIALSLGSSRMAHRHVIIRQLAAVEGLGSCTYIASDKTGTLTVDQQTVKRIVLADGTTYLLSGEGYSGEGMISSENLELPLTYQHKLFQFVEGCALCNEADLKPLGDKKGWQNRGDAVDVALLAVCYKFGKRPEEFHQEIEIIKIIPFESDRRYAAVYFKKNRKQYVIVKGATEALAPHFKPDHYQSTLEQAEQLSSLGYRVICMAKNEVISLPQEHELPPLQFLGFAALIDPLRPESSQAIAQCHRAGIKIAMVTGDHPATAFSIANELGLSRQKKEVISGKDLEEAKNLGNKKFEEKIRENLVFARLSPGQKKQIVQSAIKNNHYVAVTGDGVNDAPALVSAHIGVAMGYGTDVAKEAADIIITDNNFSSIVAGIEEGRVTYDNIRKIVYLLVSTGLAEVIIVVSALFFGTPLPFIAVQLLWLNLVTNGLQHIGLALEKGESDIMQRSPRPPHEPIFNRKMKEEVILVGVLMALIAFSFWYFMLKPEGVELHAARNELVLLMVFLENFQALNCRSEKKSLFRIPVKHNWFLILAIVFSQLLHFFAMHTPPLQDVLQLQPISLERWITLFGLSSLLFLVVELYKWFCNRNQINRTR